MRDRYGVPVGFSDHTLGNTAAIAAAALGADAIEKHFTFSRLMYGSDARTACEPGQFAALAEALREVSAIRSCPVDKDGLADELYEMKATFEKSIVSARQLAAGTVLSLGDLAFKKPGDGVGAARYRELLGRKLRRDIPADHKFAMSDFE